MGMMQELRYYLKSQSTSTPRYIVEQTIMTLLGGLPSLVGVGLRGRGPAHHRTQRAPAVPGQHPPGQAGLSR
jgi:hypothetical protein